MKPSSYPNGFTNGVEIRGVPLLNTYAGNVFWVDSAGTLNGTGTFKRPFASIDTAVGNCTANNGDIIFVKPGHVETVIAAAGLDLDVAGITVVFLGNDTERGYITFTTDTAADMDVDAANITMINPRFVAGVDALLGPIDVNAAGFKLVNATIEDAAAISAIDWLVADANADDMTIDGVLYRESTTGTQNQSLIQVAAATRPTIKNVRATGDFATGIIENGTAWVDATLENLVLDNSNSSPTVCVFLVAGSTGWFLNSSLRVASGSTGYTAANAMQIAPDVVVTGTDGNVAADPTIGNLEDAAATGSVTTTDTLMSYVKQLVTMLGAEGDTNPVSEILSGTSGITTWKTGAAPATGISMSEVLRYISENLGAVDTAAATGVVTATDSGMAYVKQLVTELQVIDEFHDVPAADNTLNAQINEVIGNKTDAAATGAVTTTDTLVGYIKQLVTEAGPRCIEKSDGAVLTGNDNLFTITGGPVRAKIVGIVTTVIGGVSNGDLQIVTTDPAATANLNAGVVAIDSDASGTSYINVGNTSVFTPTTGGAVLVGAAVAAEQTETEFILPIGTVHFRSSAAQTGVIKWYMTYWPMSPSSVVVAAA